MKAVLYIPDGAEVVVNSEAYFANGEYVNGTAGNTEIAEK